MNKYIVLCLIFAQSTMMMAAEPKAPKRTSVPKQTSKALQLGSAPVSCKRRSDEKSPRTQSPHAVSPFEFSPVGFGNEITSLTYLTFGGLAERNNNSMSSASKQ